MVDITNKPDPDSSADDRMSAFGEYLRELRKRARYSLEELATELRKRGVSKHGTSRQYLGALERGEVANPSPELLLELAKTLDAMSAEYWLLAGHVPPGPEGEAYADLIRAAHREGFSRMLKDQGLTDAMIQDVLSKVSDQTIDRVVRREEPLVIKKQAIDIEWAEHKELGFEAHTIDVPDTSAERKSAADYLGSVKEKFDSQSERGTSAAMRVSASRPGKGETISAGKHANIVVDRPLERNEREALQDIARVITHLLSR